MQVHIQNRSRLLRDDMTAVGQIAVARHPSALLVPKTALLKDPATGKATVVVIGPDGTAHVRPVTVGLPSGESVEITRGVQAGETVGISGQYGLPDGMKVQAAHDHLGTHPVSQVRHPSLLGRGFVKATAILLLTGGCRGARPPECWIAPP